MTAEPAEVTPGSHVELRFPEETQRGVAFSLEQGVDEGWSQTHMLFSDVLGDPASTPVSGQMDVPDRAVWGPGPDVVVVPSDANPGNYRVCTVNLSGNFCTTLEIVASS